MLIAYIPLLVAFVGLCVYFAATKNGKIAEAGRLAFACGLLVTLLAMANKVHRFF